MSNALPQNGVPPEALSHIRLQTWDLGQYPFWHGVCCPFQCPFWTRRWTVHLLSAAHQLAWAQHPAIWLCEACAILWLVLRVVRSPWVRAGVLLVLCGLMLNGVVIAANAGTMPVVDMPSAVHPVSAMWEAATPKTQLSFLADQAQLGLFSIGDLVMLFGGSLIVVVTCLHRALKMKGLIRQRAGWISTPRAETSSALRAR
jgi:Family of unknown function (DUF5317)